MYRKIIEQVRDELSKYGGSLSKGIDNDSTIIFNNKVEKRFCVVLPEEYIAFLKECNGFEFNGHIIYGSTDFIENNEGLIGDSDEYVYFGEYDIGWICMKNRDRTYWELDKPSGSPMRKFNCVKDMIEQFIKQAIL